MEEKIYQIAGKQFKLKKFEDYTHNEEIKIKQLLGISDESDSINLKTKDNNLIFPLLFEAVDNDVDINEFDFNEMKKGQTFEVMADWIASRVFFTQNMPNYLANLLKRKMLSIVSTNQNLGKAENSSPV